MKKRTIILLLFVATITLVGGFYGMRYYMYSIDTPKSIYIITIDEEIREGDIENVSYNPFTDMYTIETKDSYTSFCAKDTAFLATYVSETDQIEFGYGIFVESARMPIAISSYRISNRSIELIYEYTDEHYESIKKWDDDRSRVETYGILFNAGYVIVEPREE